VEYQYAPILHSAHTKELDYPLDYYLDSRQYDVFLHPTAHRYSNYVYNLPEAYLQHLLEWGVFSSPNPILRNGRNANYIKLSLRFFRLFASGTPNFNPAYTSKTLPSQSCFGFGGKVLSPNPHTVTEQKVLEFCKTLGYPVTSNEVRDKFEFSLRANARRIFKKLDKLKFGKLRKDGKSGCQYHFYANSMAYPETKTEQAKVETSIKA
jgi:hypothetical protein